MNEKVLEYDVVIIGSGAGGGTVAKELSPLCQKGLKVALLEWGGFFEKDHNTRQELEMAGKYYFGHGGVQTRQQDMTLAFAKAVGGTTTVYTGTSLKAPRKVFDRWAVPGITLDDLNPRYEKYIRENNVHLNAPDEINDNNRLFYDACQKLHWHVEQFPVNTKDCLGLGTCNLGCARHAKQGTAHVQIPAAMQNGVELFSFCRVHRLEDHDVVVEVVPAQFEQKPCSLPVGMYRFRAQKIVLCAGVMNSPTLLMKSFGEDFLPALGRYFTCHPALILVGEHKKPISNVSGHPKSFFCDEFHDSHRFILETCMYFPFTLAKNLMGFGKDLDDLMNHYANLQMILVLAIDEAEAHNRITLDRKTGAAQVSYVFNEKTKQSFVAAIRASAKIFFAAGVKRVHAPASSQFFIDEKEADQIDRLIERKEFKLGKISISAAHLMGGCRMGVDPKTSVTDSWGRVHGKKDIYVADASLFPQAVEINPYLTIMALADRVAEGIRKDYQS
jgi:choline dehydrogenase-like flavoprotein